MRWTAVDAAEGDAAEGELSGHRGARLARASLGVAAQVADRGVGKDGCVERRRLLEAVVEPQAGAEERHAKC